MLHSSSVGSQGGIMIWWIFKALSCWLLLQLFCGSGLCLGFLQYQTYTRSQHLKGCLGTWGLTGHAFWIVYFYPVAAGKQLNRLKLKTPCWFWCRYWTAWENYRTILPDFCFHAAIYLSCSSVCHMWGKQAAEDFQKIVPLLPPWPSFIWDTCAVLKSWE